MSPAQRDTALSKDVLQESGLDRAAAILAAFDAARRELTLAALVGWRGLPRSTTHQTADRMIRLGWLEKPGGRYRIGNRLFEMATVASGGHDPGVLLGAGPGDPRVLAAGGH